MEEIIGIGLTRNYMKYVTRLMYALIHILWIPYTKRTGILNI